MNNFEYIVISDTNRVIAHFAELEDAVLFVQASFEKFYAEPDVLYSIKRVTVSDKTSVINVHDHIEQEQIDEMVDHLRPGVYGYDCK